jgi:dTDP-4-dehydrorhamnose 3,5-epimerase
MEIESLTIPDVKIIKPKLLQDKRGIFVETFNEREFQEAGLEFHYVQENYSLSNQGVLRGLHYQLQNTQGKLIRVLAGEVFDAAVDIRKTSSTFGKWVGVILSAESKWQLWVPAGFAHGFYVLSPFAEVSYKITDYYSPEWERTILWNDPQLNISWPLGKGKIPILSAKDEDGKLLKDAELFE